MTEDQKQLNKRLIAAMRAHPLKSNGLATKVSRYLGQHESYLGFCMSKGKQRIPIYQLPHVRDAILEMCEHCNREHYRAYIDGETTKAVFHKRILHAQEKRITKQ